MTDQATQTTLMDRATWYQDDILLQTTVQHHTTIAQMCQDLQTCGIQTDFPEDMDTHSIFAPATLSSNSSAPSSVTSSELQSHLDPAVAAEEITTHPSICEFCQEAQYSDEGKLLLPRYISD